MIDNLCILDKPNSSFMQNNLKPMSFEKIVFPENLYTEIYNLYSACCDAGLLYPSIKINNERVILQYDYDNRYVKFTVSKDNINFIYAILNGKSKVGTTIDLKNQLKILSKFLYPKTKVEMNEV